VHPARPLLITLLSVLWHTRGTPQQAACETVAWRPRGPLARCSAVRAGLARAAGCCRQASARLAAPGACDTARGRATWTA